MIPIDKSSSTPGEWSTLDGGNSNRIEAPHPGAPEELDPETKKSFATKAIERGGRIADTITSHFNETKPLGRLANTYAEGAKMAGELVVDFAKVKTPKEATPGEIVKFTGRLAQSPFKIGIGLLAGGFMLMGMVLATPILALMSINPENPITRGRPGSESWR